MLNHEIDLKSGCVYLCRVVDGYDPWKAIGDAFSKYDILKLKVDFYNTFKAALLNLVGERVSKEWISKISFTYQYFNDIIEALYFVGVDKGVVTIPKNAARPIFPRKWVAKYGTPQSMVSNLWNMFQPYEMRDYLWDIFQNSLIVTGPRVSKRKRKEMICLYENLTDLATAAFIIGQKVKKGR